VHLRPRFSKWAERLRAKEIRFLLSKLEDDVSRDLPHVLVGDFNTLAPGDEVRIESMPIWIRTLIFISGGRIQTDTITHLLQSGYVDGFRRLHPKKRGFTFPSFSPHIRLDYIFLSPNASDCLTDCRVIDSPPAVTMASDHYPLLAVLTL
jgi:endonuclease/exonuclease/phosphatase family metal-dependent hydrolase